MILANAEFAAPLTEHEVLVFLIQLLVLVGVARLFGWVMKSINQPPVVGELLAGVVLGPTVVGNLAPGVSEWIFGEPTVDSVVFGLSWLGVIMLLIVIGFETDLAIIARFRSAALGVSAGALMLPLVGFFLVAHIVPDSFQGQGADVSVFAGFFALALSVSALPVVAKILQDLGYLRRNFGQITLAAGMTMDAVGWLILAALSGIAQDGFQPVELARSFGGLLAFLVIAATVGRWFVDRLFRFVMGRGSSVTAALSITLVAALVGGVTTQALRLEAILGAFIVGVILAGTRHQLPQVRSTLETVTAAFFAPIFFAYSGLRVDVGLLNSGEAVAWTVGLIAAAIVAKIVGTAVGGFFAGIRGREALALGSGLSALGAMGIVVAIVGLNLGVVSETGYTVMVLAALVTSVVSPQFLRAAVSGWQVPAEEAERLEREEIKDASEILASSRILLPTRGGRNSAYAARLVAAVFPEAEITVLAVDQAPRSGWRRLLGRVEESRAHPDDVMAVLSDSPNARLEQRRSRDPAATIGREAGLGYDLIVLGASENDGSSTFNSVIDRVLSLVDIPSLVVRFPRQSDVPDELPRKVLVPVTATRSTRAAEELAYSLARHDGGLVLALHVVTRPDGQGMMLAEPAVREAMVTGQDLVDEAAHYGRRLGAEVRTRVRVAPNAEEEVISIASGEDFELLVLGASNRTLTNRPFYGHRVSYMVEHSAIPVAVVSLPSGSSSHLPSH